MLIGNLATGSHSQLIAADRDTAGFSNEADSCGGRRYAKEALDSISLRSIVESIRPPFPAVWKSRVLAPMTPAQFSRRPDRALALPGGKDVYG